MSLLHNAEADFAASELARMFIARPELCYDGATSPSGLSATATREKSSSGWPYADGVVALLESGGGSAQREVAIEYKRPQEGLHGILTAIGQAQAYIHKGYGGAAIVLPRRYSSHDAPGPFADAVLQTTTSSPGIGVFCYEDPDITSPTPFADRIECVRALNVAATPGKHVGAAAAQASTQWVHMREGSTTRDAFFRFLQVAKRVSAGEPSRPVLLPTELRAAASRIDPRPAEWFLSNTSDDSLLSRIWREFWFEWVFTAEVALPFARRGGTYEPPGAFCRIARDDGSGFSQIFEGRANGLKETLASELNAGHITEDEAWERFITGFPVPGKQKKQGVRERAHSYREDVDSALGKLEWIEADGMTSDRGYRYTSICERYGGSASQAAVEYLGATLLQSGHYGSFLHYIYRLSERKFGADPLAFTKTINGSPKFTEESYWEYLAYLEDEMANNLRVMRKVSPRSRPRVRTTFQVELTLLRNYEFVSPNRYRLGIGIPIDWERVHSAMNFILMKPTKNSYASSRDYATRSRTIAGVPTAISLFTGGGGLDLGFRSAGFRVLMATDHNRAAAATYRRNHPEVPFIEADVRQLSLDQISAATNGRRPDVIIGGPPCQGFSTLGARLSADPRNDLVDAFFRIVDGLRPQAVLIENVRAIATEYKGRYRDFILQRLAELEYSTTFSVLNAAEYGVPQLRRRAFFVAFADARTSYEFPVPTHGDRSQPYRTVGDAILDLMGKGDEVPNHVSLAHSERVIARYRLIPEGGMLPPPEELPAEIRRKNFGSTYKRLSWSAPSLTIVPGNNALPVHPTLDRSLTAREAARLQGFADDHVFEGDRRSQCIQVGNAVPPPLAKQLAESIWRRIIPLKGEAACMAPSGVRREPSKRVVRRSAVSGGPAFVDLFCGAGGFKLGFERAGMRALACADNNPVVAKTHEHNYPETPFVQGDLSQVSVQQEVASYCEADVFAVVGGPPCQGFSVFGRRRMAASIGHDPRIDPRNRLVFSFVDAVARVRPRWVVMENVAGFASLDDGSFVERVAQEVRSLGYGQLSYRILDTADYGVPQHRKRFVLIANRTGHAIPWPKRKFFASPEDWQRPYRTVGEAIGDLAEPSSYTSHTCHSPMNHKPLQVERFKRIPEGGRLDIEALPPMLKAGYRTDVVKNFSHVFKRLHRNRPSITLVPGHNAFPIHPWLDRALTAREAARLQTFPDDVQFLGSRENQCIQVGNAFPPLLAELIANNLLKAESNGWYPGTVSKLARYTLLDLDEADERPVAVAVAG